MLNIIKPNKKIWWAQTHVGASFGIINKYHQNFIYNIYASCRDKSGRSRIGLIDYNVKKKLAKFRPNPIIKLGDLGTFDEMGMTYPWITVHNRKRFLFYTGWKLNKSTGFENNLGLLVFNKKKKFWERYSKASILPQNNFEPLGSGSASIYKGIKGFWMVYTCFLRWIDKKKHIYVPRIAFSKDLINWHRNYKNLIKPSQKYHSICRLNIDKNGYLYVCARGERYAIFKSKKSFILDNLFEQSLSMSDFRKLNFESYTGGFEKMQEYPHVIEKYNKKFLMFNGNDFGKSGLAITELN